MNIVLTGCTSGVGLVLANLLLADGHKIFGIGRDRNYTNSHPNFKYIQLDLSKDWLDQDQHTNLNVIHELKGIKMDVIINNAGITKRDYLEWHSLDDIKSIMNVNLMSPIYIHKYFSNDGMNQSFINILSGSAVHTFRMLPIYATAKAGLLKFYHQIHKDNEDKKLNELGYFKPIYNLLPGPIDTKLCPEHYKTKGTKVLTPIEVAERVKDFIDNKHGKINDLIDEFI